MSPAELAREVIKQADRLGLNDVELAALLGSSLTRATALRNGEGPVTTRLTRSALAFLEQAKRTSDRTALHLPR